MQAVAGGGPFDQEIGRGDDVTATFALSKRYASGEGRYVRPVMKPVAGTVKVAVGACRCRRASTGRWIRRRGR